jgi:L-alanine-DL-glutamate epimerase-like enolase superfamily enzyme
MQTHIKILEIDSTFEPLRFRTPLKFGTGLITKITLMTVRARTQNRGGKVADGWGAILLSDLWAWPGEKLTHSERDLAMRQLGQQCCSLLAETKQYAHPIDIYLERKSDLLSLGKNVTQELHLAEPINDLTVLMCAAPVDAAIHDAFGRVNGISSYDGYGPEHMSHDLSFYLDPNFAGKYISDYLRRNFQPQLPIFHLVGGVDKLRNEEVDDADPDDGLPVSLTQWIAREGVYCLKVKLRGNDLTWDIERTIEVYRVAAQALINHGLKHSPRLSVDSNEMCPNPEYVIEYCRRLEETDKDVFKALIYIEQPTERDLSAHRFDMHQLAKIKPVIVDESVVDLDQLRFAFDLGWSGVALKTCKGQTNCLLYLAYAAEMDKFYTVQDLTNPGLSFVHSAGLAARSRPLLGVEYNARQFLPTACADIQKRQSSIFTVRDGLISLIGLDAVGLGYKIK